MSAALIVLVLLPLAGAVLPALARGRRAFPGAVAVLGATLLLDAWLLFATPAGSATVLSRAWVPALDLTLALRLDRLSGATAWLISLAGLGWLWRQKRVAGREPVDGRDCALVVLFAGLAQALVFAENALLVAALAELGAIAAFALERDRAAGDGGARPALYVRSAGSLALLAAVLLVADTAGSFEFGAVLAAAAPIHEHSLFPLLFALVLGAAWSRAASWPWSRWPRGAATGDGATAGFTGAILLATGVYLVTRLWPLLHGALPLVVTGSGFLALPLLVAALERVARTFGTDEAPDGAAAAVEGRARE